MSQDLEVVVVDTLEVNAYALPDGRIVIPLGILGLVKDEGSLAGVIGHEISHIVHEDFSTQLSAILLLRGTSLAAFSLVGLPALVTVVPVAYLVEYFYRRDCEYRSDEDAVGLMDQAGFDYRDFGEFLGIKLARHAKYNPPLDDVRELTYTHPIAYKRALRVLSR